MPIVTSASIRFKMRDALLATLSAIANDQEYWEQSHVDVAILSPWISDVPLPPVGESPFAIDIPLKHLPLDNRLSSVLKALRRVDARILVATLPLKKDARELGKNHKELERERYLLSEFKESGIDVVTIEKLHAKIVSTRGATIIGSANMTYNGLYQNKEIAYLIPSYPSAVDQKVMSKELNKLLESAQTWHPL
jgi:hypothetical protein